MARGRVRRMAKNRFPLRSVRVVRKARGRARRVVRRRTPRREGQGVQKKLQVLGPEEDFLEGLGLRLQGP
jgi:hypothetical protein